MFGRSGLSSSFMMVLSLSAAPSYHLNIFAICVAFYAGGQEKEMY